MSNVIYRILNYVTNEVYIGQTVNFNQRKSRHLFEMRKQNSHKLYRAMRKYGIENFTIEPIFSVFDRIDLNEIEIDFINEYDSFNNGYNLTSGGRQPIYVSKETREKLSKASLGRIPSKETREKLSKLNTGKTVSIETREKLSKASLGRIPSKETREKMSKARLGWVPSIETRIKLSKYRGKKSSSFSGYYHTPFGILESSKDIKKYTDCVSSTSINNWCKKKSNKYISKISISKSKYLQSLVVSPLNKTFKDIGFWFENV